MLKKGNTLVSIVDSNYETFWEWVEGRVQENVSGFSIANVIMHIYVTDDVDCNSDYQFGERVETAIYALVRNLYQDLEPTDRVVQVDVGSEIELVLRSRKWALDATLFWELLGYFTGNPQYSFVAGLIRQGKEQEAKAEAALSKVVKVVSLPNPTTSITDVITTIFSADDHLRAVVGIENEGAGPNIIVHVNQDARGKFISALKFLDADVKLEEPSTIPENFRNLVFPMDQMSRVLAILTTI